MMNIFKGYPPLVQAKDVPAREEHPVLKSTRALQHFEVTHGENPYLPITRKLRPRGPGFGDVFAMTDTNYDVRESSDLRIVSLS